MTHTKTTGRGVKQGCPISPYLFTIILHYALNRACLRLGTDLRYKEIILPLLLAYDDDILIIGDSITSLTRIWRELIPELRVIGLEVNEQKCSLLIRDPHDQAVSSSSSIDIDSTQGADSPNVEIPRHIYVFCLNRRGTVSDRIKAAYKTFHILLPFLQRYKLPFDVLIQIYHSVLAPIVLYGMKVATLTKANRTSLRRMEHLIFI